MADSVPLLPEFPMSQDMGAVFMGSEIKVGMDVVRISRIQDSIRQFGERFIQRIFTEQEAAYACSSSALKAERFAARFAAKEAALKALEMADKGIAWRDMEVFRQQDGRCDLRLHARAAEHARKRGVSQMALSLSHDGDYAAAIVAVVCQSPSAAPTSPSAG